MNEFHSTRLRQRATAARVLLGLAFLVLAVSFFRAQVVQHDQYQLRAEKNRLRAVPLAAPRGIIYDRNGRIVAENVPGYTVKLLATSADSLEAVLRRFATVIPLEDEAIQDVLRRYRQAVYQPAQVMGDAPLDMVAKLEEHRMLLPGLVIQAEPKRSYPAGKAVAHVAGYVSEVSEADIENDRYPGAVPGTEVGRYGLEQEYDSVLRGERGVRYVEVDARGRMVREEGVTPPLPPVPGEPLRTTLDLELQQFTDSIWPEGIRGAMVAMTPEGQVLALYSAPAFDPNAFIGGISAREYRELADDPAHPLINRAIQARYPPASPFKLAMAVMGLKRGVVSINSRMDIPCRGGLQFGNRYFRCWKKEGHGSLDLTGAIAQSCDVYFYQLGTRLGLETVLEEGVQLGFRERSGIDLAHEISPIYPASVAYFDEAYGPRGWTAGATVMNFSIGQGENTQSVVGMTRFYQGLANGGVEHVPYLVRPTSDRTREFGIAPEQVEQLRQALVAVVERGTAARSRQREFVLAGKTGTAQNSHGKDHGWFLGFAPADKPEIVIGMVMEFAEHGSSVAPFVSAIARRYIVGPGAIVDTRRLPLVNVPADTAPRPLQLHPDSQPAPSAPVTAPGPGPLRAPSTTFRPEVR